MTATRLRKVVGLGFSDKSDHPKAQDSGPQTAGNVDGSDLSSFRDKAGVLQVRLCLTTPHSEALLLFVSADKANRGMRK